MNNVEIKVGQVAVAGRVSGLWNKETSSYEVKRGVTKNGKKYQLFEMSVSSKNQEGKYTNGKGLKVMLWGETPVNHGDYIGIAGKLQPDNYENKEGKTVYGNMINAFDNDMFEPAPYEQKGGAENKGKQESDQAPTW